MKICLVNSLYYPLVRGARGRCRPTFGRGTGGARSRVCILTTKKQLTGAWVEMEKTGQITIFRFRGYNLCSFYNLREMGAFLRLIWHIIDIISPLNYLKLRQILKKMQPELIWAHNLKGIGYFTTRLFRRQTGFYWQTIHDVQLYEPSGLLLYKKSARPLYAFGRWVYSRLVKLVLAKPNLLISPSRWLIDFYRRQGLFKKTETIVRLNPLPDWIAATTKQPLIKKDNLQLLYLGQLEEAKGVNFLVKAIQDYNRLSQMPPVFLTLVGRGSLQEKILQISDPYISCQDNV
jgi:glycosyltransferase involved in cell wall biosynthesis